MKFLAVTALPLLLIQSTPQHDTKLLNDLERVGKISAELINECQNDEDAVRVAIALTQAAKTIYINIGGRELAAREFEAAAHLVRMEPKE